MDYEEAIQHMGAENIALQTLLVALMDQLVASGHKDIAKGAFDRADKTLETAVIAMGDKSPPWYTRRALEVLEQFRGMSQVDK